MNKRAFHSYIYVVILFSMLVLVYSIWMIVSSVQGKMEGKADGFYFGLIAGIVGVGLALSSLIRLRNRLILFSKGEGKTSTVVECLTCKIKTIRDFQKGDYVNKRLEKCPKCGEDKIITAIYLEKPLKQ
ncbi:MAG: hypothetical protein ACP5K1_03670 [Candidatus Bathyarchaeia archaeon]